METTSLGPSLLWLLILLFPALLVTALCLCCRDLPGPNSEVPGSEGSSSPRSRLVILKRPNDETEAQFGGGKDGAPGQEVLRHRVPLIFIPLTLMLRGQGKHPVGQICSLSRSEPSYENEDPEDAEKGGDYHNECQNNEDYLVVLPDGCLHSSLEPLSHSAPNLDNSSLRDSPSSLMWGDDYVNVSESTEVSLGGSCEYVNVPEAQEERTPSSRTPVTDQDGDEEGPNYENVQEQNGHSFT